jgi:hypothetical protein
MKAASYETKPVKVATLAAYSREQKLRRTARAARLEILRLQVFNTRFEYGAITADELDGELSRVIAALELLQIEIVRRK